MSSKVIDDTDPLVEYDLPSEWNVTRGWEGNGVTTGTLHVTDSYEVGAWLNFTGDGIAVTSLLNPNGANLTIILDGVLSGPYSLHVDSDADSKVATVFSRTGLKDGDHRIIVRKIPDDPLWQGPVPGQRSLVNIDTFIVSNGNPQVTMSGTATMPRPPASSGSGAASTVSAGSPTLSAPTSSSSPVSTARPGNQTVDDTNALLSWDDASSWETQTGKASYGLYDGTLHVQHDYNKAVTISFQGTAIYMQSLMWWTGCNFTVNLDGFLSGPYSLLTLDPLQIQPAIVYFAQELDPTQTHTLVVRKIPDDPGYVSRLPDERTSQLNVDAFFITGGGILPTNGSNPGPDPAQVPAPAGAIAGGVVGGVALIALLAAVFLWHRRRRTHTPTKSNSPTDVLAYQFYPPESSTMGSIKDPVSPSSFVAHEEMAIASPGPLAIRPYVIPAPSQPSPTSPTSPVPPPGNRKERIALQVLPPSPTTPLSPNPQLASDPSSPRAVILETPVPTTARKGRRRDGSISSPSLQPSDSMRLSHTTSSGQSDSNNATMASPVSPISHDDLRGEIEDLRRELRILQSPNGIAGVPPPSYDRARAAS